MAVNKDVFTAASQNNGWWFSLVVTRWSRST